MKLKLDEEHDWKGHELGGEGLDKIPHRAAMGDPRKSLWLVFGSDILMPHKTKPF